MKNTFRSINHAVLLFGIITMLLAGGSVAHAQSGRAWGWGNNAYGQLGDGTVTRRATPVLVPRLANVTQFSASHSNSLALLSDGTVWVWGELGRLKYGRTPVQVSGLTGIAQVAAGWIHSLALKSDGTVWAWGTNAYGQLGDGTKTNRSTPIQTSSLTGVVQVSLGYNYSLALKSDGTVWEWGGEIKTPVQVSGLTGVVQVSLGYNHSLALKSDGTVWAWGSNGRGKLGDGTNAKFRDTPVQVVGLTGGTQVSAGAEHSLALLSDGSLWAWGDNSIGQLGGGTNVGYKNVPVQVVAVKEATMISAGGYHSLSDGYGEPSNTQVFVSNVTLVYGQISLSATLQDMNSVALPNEPVAFTLNGVSVGTANTNASGKVALLVPNPAAYSVGTYSYSATYAGDIFYNSSSASATLVIKKAPTKIAGRNVSGKQGATVTLTATLTRMTDKAALAGKAIRFQIEGVDVGVVTTIGNGVAYLSHTIPTTLAVGKHTITTVFDGDEYYLGYSGSSNTLTVK